MPIWRHYRDPCTIPRPTRHEDLISPFWNADAYQAMDEKFIHAMRQAGYSITQCSTHAGTKAPLHGYCRPDSFVLP